MARETKKQPRGKFKPSIADIRLGAIYRYARKHRIGRAAVETLFIERLGMTSGKAKRLAAIWFGNFRHNPLTSESA